MADKMKEQQRQQRDQARRDAAKTQAAKEKPQQTQSIGTESLRRSRNSKESDQQTETVEKRGKDRTRTSNAAPGKSRTSKPVSLQRGASDIASYFKPEDIPVQEDGSSVQEALAKAADDYEAKPEGLGAQDLVATQQPALVTGGEMRTYQLEGLEWLKSLWMNGLCGILADEMGLGKTIQAISMIAFFKEKNISGPFLIAAPLSTVNNWIDEFARWTPSISTVLYHGSKDDRAEIRRKRLKMQDQKKQEFPVVVTSYEICMNDRKFLGNYQWRYIIVDEGHRLKNMNCRLIKELLTYNSANRLLITGTPLQNNIAELWSLLHFLLPEVFNDLSSFESWFDFSSVLQDTSSDGVGEKRKQNLVSTMHAILKPFLLRRVKTDVESSLPRKREYIIYAPLTSEQQELYQEILAGTSRSYLEGKAVERIEAKSRTASLKRKANDSGRSTPAKNFKTSRSSTPASAASAAGSVRRGRKGRLSYKDITDREFNAKLRRLENGELDNDLDEPHSSNQELSSSEEQEIVRAANLRLAKKEIANKKLQNPVMQARLACNSPHNFYWPWQSNHDDEEEDDDGKNGEVLNANSERVDSSLVTASGKLLLLDQLLPRLFSENHKVLIFSQFKTTLDILETYASVLRNWEVCRIDGSISQSERSEQIKAFNSAASDVNLFLLSTRAGGQGINLTAADTVILFDSDWNPQQDLQAIDRAHRIGQTKPVLVYRLATQRTVEEALLGKAEKKRKLEKVVIREGKFRSLLEDGKASGGKRDKSQKELGLAAAGGKELRMLLTGGGEEGLAEDDPANNYHSSTTTSNALTSEGNKTTPKLSDAKSTPTEILTTRDLDEITDRSDAAYERAEQGILYDHGDNLNNADVGSDINNGMATIRLAETTRSEEDRLF